MATLAFALLGALSAPTHATPEQSIALDYAAPPACPNETRFRESVEELTRAVRWDSAALRRFVVRIDERKTAPSHARFAGSVREGQSASAPSVEADDCRDVASALALTVALAIDPEALSEPATDATDATTTEPVAPPSNAPAVSKPAPRTTARIAARDEAAAPPPTPWGLELGLSGSLHFARGPSDATPLAALGAEVLRRAAWRASAELDVGWGRSASSELTLRWEPSARLALCPLWWEPTRGLSLVGCVGGEVARLTSDGSGDIPLPAAERTFGAVDARARVRFRFSPLVVEVFGGAELPLTEIEYRELRQDGSERVLFEVDQRVSGVAGVGVSAEIF